MSVLAVANVSKTYGLQPVLNGATLHLHDGEHVGLVGVNGAGKSTLLKIIVDEVAADSGTINIPPDVQVGYLAQAIQDYEGKTVAALVAESMDRLRALESRMRALEQAMADDVEQLDSIMAEYGAASEQFERYGGYEMDYRVDQVFAGLGIAHLERERDFATLSGGEKARVGLAILLLSAPDVLLLDEPTNHLDFASLEWLETYLQGYRGAFLIVSHDRQFLNRTVASIIEIDEHTRQTKQYGGNYDTYLRAKTAALEKWRVDYARQQDEIKALREAVKVTARRNSNYRVHRDNDKFIPVAKKANHEATVAKRVRVAEEKLRRIELNPILEPPGDMTFQADFDVDALHGRAPVWVNGLTKGFAERCVLDEVHFQIEPRSRIILMGENGAGKSTLLKLLAGYEQPDAGEIYINPGVKIGYLEQEGELLNPAQTVFEAFCDGLDSDQTEQQMKATLLHSGLFRYAELERAVGDLSGGQQRKVAIARLIASRANLLLLDEPTNSISFDVLEAFEAALRTFPGAVLAISHDRRFIEQFGGVIWRLADGKLR
jgi:macrolide transport system ATP-binding/permease protein